MADSPLDEEPMEAAAGRVRAAWRLVAARAPEGVRRRVETTLDEFDALSRGWSDLEERRRLAHALERLEDELRGRSGGSGGFYDDARLGLIRRMDPVTIRETINDARVREHVDRYESRVRRAMGRLEWFFERAGMQVEEPPELAPWDQPYAKLEADKEHVQDE